MGVGVLRRRRAVKLLLITGLVYAGLPVAMASGDCQQRGQFFIKNTTDKSYVNGTTNKIFLRDRVLAPNCVNPLTLSTAHLNRNQNGTIESDFFVEIGWREREKRDGSGDKVWVAFVEKCSLQQCVVDEISMASTAQVGTFDLWRIENRPKAADGTTEWRLYVNYLDGFGYRYVENYFTDYHHGAAYGETEAFGDNTGMTDEQRALEHLNNSGAWVDWNGQRCAPNFAKGGYKYVQNSNISYDIIDGGNNACD